MKKFNVVLLALTTLFALVGCNVSGKTEKINIYTTNYAQKFILNSLGKDHVNAYSVYDNSNQYQAGDDSFKYVANDPNIYTFENNPEMLDLVLKADLFIYNGNSANDRRLLSEIVEADKDEDLQIFDATENAKRSLVETTLALSYDGKVVDNKILDVIETESEMEMFWLSPIETMNVADEIYEKLITLLPNVENELKQNYDALMYDLSSLYAGIEDIQTNNINNMIVSDTVNLNVLGIHYIENIYLDHTHAIEYKNDQSGDRYYGDLSKYIKINESTKITTTNPSSPNNFDLLEVQSASNFDAGLGYFEIMKNNYELLERLLK